MQITLKRRFPWFPIVLAAGWILMMVLSIHDLAWFAAASASLDARSTRVPAPDTIPAAGAAVKLPLGVTPCTAAAIAPAGRMIR